MEDRSAAVMPPVGDGPKVLFYDIETRPKVGLYFGPEWQTRIAKKIAGTELLTFAYRWEGSDESHLVTAWEQPNWRAGLLEVDQDRWVLQRLWALFDAADVVVAHNGNKFDQKKSFGRMLRYGMRPPSHFIEVDTLLLSRTFFGLDSHKLDELAKHLGLDGKVSHSGIDLWEGCMLGVEEDQETMGVYNLQDTVLLEEVFEKFEPWIGFNGKGRKFNRALWAESGEMVCPNCGGYDLAPNGYRETATTRRQSYLCSSIRSDGSVCGARPTERSISKNKKGLVLK